MKFLVVDDDWLTRGGIVKTLETLRPGAELKDVATLADAFAFLAETPEVDLVILDLNLRGSSGIDTLLRFRSWCEDRQIEPRVVVLSGAAAQQPELVAQVLTNQGTGFILKSTNEQIFEHALELTLAGGVFIPAEAVRILAPQADTTCDDRCRGRRQFESFTNKETEVAALLIQGMTYKRIAQVLEKRHLRPISENTVRTHVGNIAWKLGVTTNAKAGVMAEIARRGLRFNKDS